MRVKISKTVELDDVPNEYEKVLENIGAYLYDLQNSIEDIPQYTPETHDQCIKMIFELREKLILADANLEDAIGMIDGYRKIVEGKDAVSTIGNQQPLQD